ncbi:MAG: amidohydrolase family protein, partial [Bacillota bacterium]|nr:amidohydrolase family protein [Bacillota bacterium]
SDEPELTRKLLDSTHKSQEIVAVIGQIRVDSADFSEDYDRFSLYEKFRGIRFTNKTVQGIQMARNIASVNGKSANIIEILGHWKRTMMLDGLIRDNPGVIFVIEHFGGYPFTAAPMPDAYLAFLELMASHPNTHIKLSGFMTLCPISPKPTNLEFYWPVFDACYTAFGENRCLFGSDWPVMGDRTAYTCAVKLTRAFCRAKSVTAEERIMGENAMSLYKIGNRQTI